jgi:hypothetical protein
MRQLEFDEFVGGIEDGICAALTPLKTSEGGYLKTLGFYGGELDAETLRAFVRENSPNFPLVLVSYTDGEDVYSPPVAVAFDQPRIVEHRCTFSVIGCADDARGDKARRRGAAGGVGLLKMMADVRAALAGLRLRAEVIDPETEETDNVLLTLDPLTLAGHEFIARMPQMTAYAQHVTTRFKWREPDRRAAGTPVSELIINVTPSPPSRPYKPNLPGVEVN